MTAAGPIRDGELERLFAGTLPFPVALAVSGGADSVALLHLVHRWMRSSNISNTSADGFDSAVVLTVDHRLRPESSAEARWVADLAQRLGFRHESLVWQGEKPVTGIQDAARTARYRLLGEFVAREGLGRAAVTAHHQDDQAETLLMRLARGSGLDGLAGMRRRSQSGGLTLVRPLLGVPKARLLATLTSAGEPWLEDPGNDSDRFERVRWRNAGGTLAALGLGNEQIALSARRLARARDALQAAAFDLARQAQLDLHEGAYAGLDAAVFREGAEELQVRMLARLIARFSGHAVPPSLASVEDLCARLQSRSTETSTLGGCVVSSDGVELQICREMGREGLAEIALRAGEPRIWDGRFTVSFQGCCETGEITAGALGEAGWRDVRSRLESPIRMPPRAVPVLPAFRAGGCVVSVPHLRFHAVDYGRQVCTATFIWPG